MDGIYISNIYTSENNFLLNKLDTLWGLLHQTLSAKTIQKSVTPKRLSVWLLFHYFAINLSQVGT